ncbi:N-acyl homoserine lactonase family protein [Companilactobacillus huachuanensis]|uniref:N-acyl homoserine lactonase family protein n=1 Tax=Companilactobacillus huachuanensis TaxID=2559914 RepID=A0ABW1RHS1_9LACO|nr:N-acyl homoserine lactonase family protein [Companilactobacillus huachuanensis]
MSAKIKIHVLHTGLVKVDRALPYHGLYRNPMAFTGLFRSEVNQVTVPVSSYLIEHPKGLILIDTGWNKTIRQSNWKELGPQMQVNKGYLPAGWAVDERLDALGYQPTDLDYVLMSHLHCDHASGMKLIKDAKKILVSSDEWQAANKLSLVYLPHEWAGVNVETFDFNQSKIGPFNKSFDLFGDGSVVQIYTPGHSSGLTSTLIRGKDGKYVLLAADTGYSEMSWGKMLTPGICVNRNQAVTSLGWTREMAYHPACVAAIANHDPEVEQQIIELEY